MGRTSEDIEALLALLGFLKMDHLAEPHNVWLHQSSPTIQVTPEGCYIKELKGKLPHDEAWGLIVKLYSGGQSDD